MKIILISIGTRGDIEPFLAIGEILKEKGHQVICAFPEQFSSLVEDSNMEFASLGPKFIEMLDSDVGKAILGDIGSGLKKIIAYIKFARNSTDINRELIKKQYELIESENPDRIVYNGKAIYPIIWGLDKRGKTILISPVPYIHYVRNHTHIGFHGNFGPFLNKLTYSLANFGLIMTVGISIKWLKITKKITRKQIKNALLSNKIIYTISPSLFPRPDYWNENIKVLGYHERDKTVNWKADKSLEQFVANHDKILFITFGSMINPEPKEKTKQSNDANDQRSDDCLLHRHQLDTINVPILTVDPNRINVLTLPVIGHISRHKQLCPVQFLILSAHPPVTDVLGTTCDLTLDGCRTIQRAFGVNPGRIRFVIGNTNNTFGDNARRIGFSCAQIVTAETRHPLVTDPVDRFRHSFVPLDRSVLLPMV